MELVGKGVGGPWNADVKVIIVLIVIDGCVVYGAKANLVVSWRVSSIRHFNVAHLIKRRLIFS